MTAPHLHMLVNHIPIIGVLLALPLLLVALLRRKDAGLFSAAVLVLVMSGLGAGAAILTGDPAEESVEDLPGISEKLIHQHEDRADVSAMLAGVTAVAAAAAWWLSRRKGETAMAPGLVTSALALVTMGAMTMTGYSGGEIRHPEIDVAAVASVAAVGGSAREAGETEEDEESEHATTRGESDEREHDRR